MNTTKKITPATLNWQMVTVGLTLNNGTKSFFITSMLEKDKKKAQQLALAENWISGVKSVDSVVFDK